MYVWTVDGVLAPTATRRYDVTMEEQSQQDQIVRPAITWEALEHVHVEKTPDWYWALGLIAVAGAVGALLYNNILFAVLILIAAFVLALLAARQPDVFRFATTQRGVRIDDELYPYNTIESFTIEELSPNHTPKLLLKPKKIFAPLIVIPIEGVEADEVHDFLLDFLPEGEHTEPLTNHVMEWLGF